MAKCGSEEWKKNISISLKGRHKGSENPNWKGGKNYNSQGYVMIYSPNHPLRNCKNYVLEHRLVMEKRLGRYLTKEEVVHHINEIRNDNRYENLELLNDLGEHNTIHKTKIR